MRILHVFVIFNVFRYAVHSLRMAPRPLSADLIGFDARTPTIQRAEPSFRVCPVSDLRAKNELTSSWGNNRWHVSVFKETCETRSAARSSISKTTALRKSFVEPFLMDEVPLYPFRVSPPRISAPVLSQYSLAVRPYMQGYLAHKKTPTSLGPP